MSFVPCILNEQRKASAKFISMSIKPFFNGLQIHPTKELIHFTTLITSPINFLLYFKNGKSNQHEIFTIAIAKSFSETNNHVRMIEKYFVFFTAYVRI